MSTDAKVSSGGGGSASSGPPGSSAVVAAALCPCVTIARQSSVMRPLRPRRLGHLLGCRHGRLDLLLPLPLAVGHAGRLLLAGKGQTVT
jgi:hypothetical protein